MEGEQQLNEEKEEILRLLRGWQDRETSSVVRGAWADDIGEDHRKARRAGGRKCGERAGGASVSTEAQLAHASTKLHSNNTAELSRITEALSFLGPMAPSPAIRKLVSSMIPSMRPAFAWVRFSHARMSPWV